MAILQFVRANFRWVAAGFLLTFFSSYGQTFFIALSAGNIRAEYGLSHGEFGSLYMFATLASALTLARLGRIVDTRSTRDVTLIVIPALAFACLLMAVSGHLILLFVTIFMLRLFGQGMMSQIAFTSTARWFAGQRGRALSLTAIGVNAGEALFPILFVLVAGLVGWRGSWLAAAAVMVALALPAIVSLTALERTPRLSDPAGPSSPVRDWTRAEVLGDPLFYLLLVGIMAPPFIGTTIFFHQVYLVELRGWSVEIFASAFAVSAAMTVTCALLCGYLIDRFSAKLVLPTFLVPLTIACFVLAGVEAQWGVFAFMGLLGVSYGFTSTLHGALWPEIYGLSHLGAIRAMISSVMVFATAAGPGLTGWLIDLGVDFPNQVAAMGVWTLLAVGLLIYASQRLRARALSLAPASDSQAG